MADFRSTEEALQAMDDEAAADAWEYLEKEKPATAKAIQFFVEVEKWASEKIISKIERVYGLTEEKTQHKMKLVVEALIRERDKDA